MQNTLKSFWIKILYELDFNGDCEIDKEEFTSYFIVQALKSSTEEEEEEGDEELREMPRIGSTDKKSNFDLLISLKQDFQERYDIALTGLDEQVDQKINEIKKIRGSIHFAK